MKANVPEKIYLATTKEVQNLDTSFVGVAHSNPKDIVEPIEYTRTDAFIEKAWSFIEDNFLSANQQDNCELYRKQFIKAMKL